MATPQRALAPQVYTWTFPGCPVRIVTHLGVIDALQNLAQTLAGPQQGLLYGTRPGGATEVRNTGALPGFTRDEIQEAIKRDPGAVVGYYRIREGDSLVLSDEEVRYAETAGFQPGSVVLLVERRGPALPESTFFFQERGEVLNFPLLPFALDSKLLAQREARRRGADETPAVIPAVPKALRRVETPPVEVSPVPIPQAPAVSNAWLMGAAVIVSVAALSAGLIFRRTESPE